MITLNAKHLRSRLNSCASHEFPAEFDYLARLNGIEAYLGEHVHPAVTTMASFVDGGYLTDHGPTHVSTVIDRASQLVSLLDTANLTCYEIYLLIAAINLHDIGNLEGRDGHERQSAYIMAELGNLFGPDEAEKRLISRIAEAHGGRNGKDKDKISRLQARDYLFGQAVRSQFLAALLRFADELADDRSRTTRLESLMIKVPSSSEVFHRYAHALHSVVLEGGTVYLRFETSREIATRKLGKGEEEVFLLDEIYDRTVKMHTERMYCMRFLRPFMNIDKVDVSVEIFGKDILADPLARISYRIVEAGYPSEPDGGIFTLCPELRKHSCGSPLTGTSLSEYLEVFSDVE